MNIRYDKESIWVDDIQRYCERPRLEFIRELSKYPEITQWIQDKNGNAINIKAVKIEGPPNIGFHCTIGATGFGFELDEEGKPVRMPHFGHVLIKNGVRIGSNVCIDRAVLGSTVIGENVKIDNLVHIAHGAKIGANSFIIAGAVIGGSVEIGENCYIGMGALIKNKIKLGNSVTIGMGAVVIRDVNDGEVIIGNPGRVLRVGNP